MTGRRPVRAAVAVMTAALLMSLSMATTGRDAAAQPTELFFSEYVEGSSNNKALELYNGTDAEVNLFNAGYSVQMFFNGSPSAGLTINLTGMVAAGDVYVLAQASADPGILGVADQTNGAAWFTGDDAVVLRRMGTIIDSIGQVGVDPGTEWGTGSTSTADGTLRRKAAVQAGDPIAGDSFDPPWSGRDSPSTSSTAWARTFRRSSGARTQPGRRARRSPPRCRPRTRTAPWQP